MLTKLLALACLKIGKVAILSFRLFEFLLMNLRESHKFLPKVRYIQASIHSKILVLRLIRFYFHFLTLILNCWEDVLMKYIFFDSSCEFYCIVNAPRFGDRMLFCLENIMLFLQSEILQQRGREHLVPCVFLEILHKSFWQ